MNYGMTRIGNDELYYESYGLIHPEDAECMVEQIYAELKEWTD